ncbi:hypothetical protein DLJ48_04180 [Oenococcus sicerae]|uniref:Uncharacterized protein n=1 Tax=Oenococcus sicerae TaxID=2203724 RepID=A0ABX5QM32_9LACO|nr:hypothetical protein [Oenococcus sicerae]QAS69774.1 hypothetical protein DLJ48_04180 [Oenococcus sicerae]
MEKAIKKIIKQEKLFSEIAHENLDLSTKAGQDYLRAVIYQQDQIIGDLIKELVKLDRQFDPVGRYIFDLSLNQSQASEVIMTLSSKQYLEKTPEERTEWLKNWFKKNNVGPDSLADGFQRAISKEMA